MNRRSKANQLDNKGCQRPLATLEDLATPERLLMEKPGFSNLSEIPDENQENQGLLTSNLTVSNLSTTHHSGVANISPPLKGGSVSNPSNASPTFDELITLRHRLNDGVAWCQRRIGSPGKQRRGIDRYVRLLVQEYMPGIREHRNSDHDYAAELATVEARLTRGADVDGHDDLFTELLTTYEVLYDITHEDAIARHLDRMEYVTA